MRAAGTDKRHPGTIPVGRYQVAAGDGREPRRDSQDESWLVCDGIRSGISLDVLPHSAAVQREPFERTPKGPPSFKVQRVA